MPDFQQEIARFLDPSRVVDFGRALLILLFGLTAARVTSAALGRALGRRLSAQHVMLAQRAAVWLIVGATLVSTLHHLGFDLSVFMGAAGILTVALGFASQTSASNLISGIFLIAERPFVVGDVITVGNRTGEVTAVDLLSVKLRTFDNLFVRIPNETLLKSEIVNVSYYPIRRADFTLGVSYAEDLSRVRETLLAVAAADPMCLDEPRPVFTFIGFTDSAQSVRFGVWATRENYIEVSVRMPQAIKRAFDAAGIEIPFPQHVIHYARDREPPPPRTADVPVRRTAPA